MSDVFEKIESKYSGNDLKLLEKAYDYAKKAHENQKRASGEPYFTHPCAVAEILIDLGLDASTVAAAFLHDVIEDTPVTAGDIRSEFNEEVLELVEGVTKLEKIDFASYEMEQAENFRKIFVAMAKDIRVIMIKLADRLHNMRSLNFLSIERQKRIAKETLEIYAPVADRLGISRIKYELEDLCLKYLEPEVYSKLIVDVEKIRHDYVGLVESVVADLKVMVKESNINDYEVFGREKNLYSIYSKMQKQNKPLDQIFDLFAVRVIVETVDQCYEILGKIHNRWKPVPGRIKDYIATPKANMYRSLHTTVVTNFGKIFEIQIRTFEMNHAAEYGIAAHWKYKENKKETDDFDKRLNWIREIMEWQGSLKDSKEFINTIKGDVYNSEVLVFTPKGDVISLPYGATPLDYAYNIHSEVGNRCVGAKVNSKMVPLNYTLKVGDIVEILTSPNSKGPSWDWLKIVKSPSAKVKIKQFFRKEMKEENVKLGKEMLEDEAKRRGYELSEILTEESFARLASKLSFSNFEEMYASVGFGAVSTNQVLLKLIDVYKKRTPDLNRTNQARPQAVSSVRVKDMPGLLVRFAGCCNPVPGDDIIGFISHGRGVTIHCHDCPNLKQIDKERLIEVSWTNVTDNSYNVSLRIIGDDQTKVLTTVINQISKSGLSVSSTNSRTDVKNKRSVLDIVVRVNDKQELEKLIDVLKTFDCIQDVFRTAN